MSLTDWDDYVICWAIIKHFAGPNNHPTKHMLIAYNNAYDHVHYVHWPKYIKKLILKYIKLMMNSDFKNKNSFKWSYYDKHFYLPVINKLQQSI